MTARPTGVSGSVLVVDDDRDTADSIRDTLRRRGFDAQGVYSAEDCLTWVRTHEVDVVITDVAIGSPRELITLDEMERRYIRHVLGLLRGNKTRAARTLGIDRRSLYRRLEAFEQQPPAVTMQLESEP